MKRFARSVLYAAFGLASCVLAACGSGTSTTFSQVPVPSFSPSGPQAAPVATAAATMSPNGSAAGMTFAPSYTSGITSVTVALGATTTSGSVQIGGWAGNPTGTQPLTASVGPSPVVYGYLTMSASATATFSTTPSIIVNFGASATTSGMSYYVAYLAPGTQSWQQPLLGPASAGSTSQFTLPANLIAGAFTMQAKQTYTFAIYAIPTPVFTDDWTTYAHDQARTGFQTYATNSSALGVITPQNVSSLALAWSIAPNPSCDTTAAAAQIVAVEPSVLVANGLVYYTDTCGYIAALNRDTGAVVWHVQAQVQNQVDGALGTPVLDNGLLIVPIWGDPGNCTDSTLLTCDRANGGYLIALDALKGAVKWQTPPLALGNMRGEPFALNGQVYEGISGGDDSSGYVNGGLAVFNETTGAQIGTTLQFAPPTSVYGTFDGGSSWTPITYDGTNLYLGTGNTRDNLGPQDGVLLFTPQSGAMPVRSNTFAISTYDSTDTDEDVGGGVMIYGGNLYFTGKNGNFYAYSASSSAFPLVKTGITRYQPPGGKGGIGTPTTDGSILTVSNGYNRCESSDVCTQSDLECFTLGASAPFASIPATNSAIYSYAAFAKGVGFIGTDNGATDNVPPKGTPVLPEFVAFDDTCHVVWKANQADVKGFFYGGPAVVASGVYAVDNAGNVYAWKLPYQLGPAARMRAAERVRQTPRSLLRSTHYVRRHRL